MQRVGRALGSAWALARQISTTRTTKRASDNFVMQLRLPGRTTGSLSTGVVAYANDPMVARNKYFKPAGLDSDRGLRFMQTSELVTRVSMPGFLLAASPWNEDEHPRDHNGLRIRDYRVACVASKKKYSKKAFHRWRATRLLRTAAALVLPDKGLKRCDYLLVARPAMRVMDRDALFLMVEQAIVQAESRIAAAWTRTGRRHRPRVPDELSAAELSHPSAQKPKILQQHRQRHIDCVSKIIEDLADADHGH